MGVASQDFRDGAATGATELAKRIRVVNGYGVTITPSLVESMAAELVSMWGGCAHAEREHS